MTNPILTDHEIDGQGRRSLNPKRMFAGKVPMATEVHMVIEISREDGKEPPRTVSFDKNEVVVGRSDAADIVLINELLSRRAIRIVDEDGGFFLNDGSANGSFINGVHAWGKRPFSEGDEIRVGPFTLRVHRQQKAG